MVQAEEIRRKGLWKEKAVEQSLLFHTSCWPLETRREKMEGHAARRESNMFPSAIYRVLLS